MTAPFDVTERWRSPTMPGLSRSKNLPLIVTVPAADDLAIREHARRADDQLGPRPMLIVQF
jgi:hypothetical protein